jgi:hypothetical protein
MHRESERQARDTNHYYITARNVGQVRRHRCHLISPLAWSNFSSSLSKLTLPGFCRGRDSLYVARCSPKLRDDIRDAAAFIRQVTDGNLEQREKQLLGEAQRLP